MTSTTFFIIFIPILSLILLAVNLLLSTHNPYQEKNSPFECGFHSFLYQNRTQFSVSFFIFGILFLLFDLEIVLIFPYSVSAYNNNIYGLFIMIIFFVLLTLGFIFELGKNALFIDSRQVINIIGTNNTKNKILVYNSFNESKFLQSGLPYFDPDRRIVFFRHREYMPSNNPFSQFNGHLTFTGSSPVERTYIVGIMHPYSNLHVNEFHIKEGESKLTNWGRLKIIDGKPVFIDSKEQIQSEPSIEQVSQVRKLVSQQAASQISKEPAPQASEQPAPQANEQSTSQGGELSISQVNQQSSNSSSFGNVNCDSPNAWGIYFQNNNITFLESISTLLIDIIEFTFIFYLFIDLPVFFILRLVYQYRVLLIIDYYYSFKSFYIMIIHKCIFSFATLLNNIIFSKSTIFSSVSNYCFLNIQYVMNTIVDYVNDLSNKVLQKRINLIY